MKGCCGSKCDWGTSSKRASELLVEVTLLAVLFCCYFARNYITNLLCLDFEYLGGPTSEREVSHPLLEQPLKFIAHGHIFFLRDYCKSHKIMSTAVILMAYASVTRTQLLTLLYGRTVQQQLWAIQYTVMKCSNN